MTGRARALALAAGAALVAIVFIFGFDSRNGDREAPASGDAESRRASDSLSGARGPSPVAGGIAEKERLAPEPATGPSIRGTVVDPDGRPVPGARVIAFAGDSEAAPAIDGDPIGGADGRFEIGGLDPALRYDVVADAARFAPGTVRAVAPGSDVVVVLEPGASLRGVVRDMAERPVAGARVTWRAIVHGVRWERSAVSSEDGAYRIDVLPGWRSFMDRSLLASNLVASAPGYATVQIDRVTVDRGEKEGVRDIYLSRPGRVVGRVLDAESESPLAGARVRLLPGDVEFTYFGRWDLIRTNPFAAEPLAEAVSDGDGRFAWDGVAAWGVHTPGTAWFGLASLDSQIGEAVASAPGYVTGVASVATPDAGAAIEVEIRCWPAAVVAGRVVDESLRPIPGVDVAASNPDCRARPLTRDACDGSGASARTDAAGRYRLAGVPARRHAASTISIRVASADRETSVTLRAGETAEAPDIVIPSRPRLVVRVTDLDGRPVRGAAVAEGVFLSPRGHTDAAGLFELRDSVYEPGPMASVRVWVSAEGYGSEVSEAATPSASEPPPSTTVRLGPEHRISGRVEYESGEPVESARVLVALANAAPEDVFIADDGTTPPAAAEWLRADDSTASDGTFEVRSLPPGPYHVQVRRYSRDALPESERVVAENVPTGARDLRLVLADPGEEELQVPLEGTVRDRETGELLVRIRVSLRRPGRYGSQHAAAFAPGRFRFDALEPGTYDLEVAARGYATAILSGVAVRAASARENRPLDVRLDRGVVVRGTVRATTGEPILEGTVSFTGSRSVERETAQLGRDGSYEATGLERGARYSIAVLGKTPEGETRYFWPVGGNAFVVPANEDVVTRDVEVSPAGSCVISFIGSALYPRGDVADGEGEAAALARLREGARIEVVGSDGRVVWERSGFHSPMLWFMVPDGEHVVRLHVPGLPPAERPVAVRLGEFIHVSFGAE